MLMNYDIRRDAISRKITNAEELQKKKKTQRLFLCKVISISLMMMTVDSSNIITTTHYNSIGK